MSRLDETIGRVDVEGTLGASPDEGTERYRRTRSAVLDREQARDAHDRLSAELDGYVDRKQATLAQIRRAIGLTQSQLAEELGIAQSEVSKIERRGNLHLATLARFVAATGGKLRVVAVYDDTEVDLEIGNLEIDA